MLDHAVVYVSDYAKSRAFYEQALAPLGYRIGVEPLEGLAGFVVEDRPGAGPVADFWLKQQLDVPSRVHLAFTAQTRDQVDSFHAAALAAGGRDNGPAGLRPIYHAHYYGAYVLDPDGSNIEAVCHRPG